MSGRLSMETDRMIPKRVRFAELRALTTRETTRVWFSFVSNLIIEEVCVRRLRLLLSMGLSPRGKPAVSCGQMNSEPKPISIPPEIAERCDGPNQFEKFDQLFRTVIAVPKSAILKEEAKWKRSRAKKKARNGAR